jgi:hypothetical protein
MWHGALTFPPPDDSVNNGRKFGESSRYGVAILVTMLKISIFVCFPGELPVLSGAGGLITANGDRIVHVTTTAAAVYTMTSNNYGSTVELIQVDRVTPLPVEDGFSFSLRCVTSGRDFTLIVGTANPTSNSRCVVVLVVTASLVP